MLDSESAGHRGLGAVGVGDRKEVERVRVSGQRHEEAAVLRILLHDLEPEDRRVERPRAFQIPDAQQHVADALELHHVPLSRSLAGRGQRR